MNYNLDEVNRKRLANCKPALTRAQAEQIERRLMEANRHQTDITMLLIVATNLLAYGVDA